MSIKDYSTNPALNNAPPPNGWPEGMAPSTVNDSARQNMADIRAYAEAGGWFDWGDAYTWRTVKSFNVVGTGANARYLLRRMVRVTGSPSGKVSIGQIRRVDEASANDVEVFLEMNDVDDLINETLDVEIGPHPDSLGLPEIGTIVMMTLIVNDPIPIGWRPCNGQAQNIVDYPLLYEQLGDRFGFVTEGVDFLTPDLRGYVIAGEEGDRFGRLPGIGDETGSTGGAPTHLLSAAESGQPGFSASYAGTGDGSGSISGHALGTTAGPALVSGTASGNSSGGTGTGTISGKAAGDGTDTNVTGKLGGTAVGTVSGDAKMAGPSFGVGKSLPITDGTISGTVTGNTSAVMDQPDQYMAEGDPIDAIQAAINNPGGSNLTTVLGNLTIDGTDWANAKVDIGEVSTSVTVNDWGNVSVTLADADTTANITDWSSATVTIPAVSTTVNVDDWTLSSVDVKDVSSSNVSITDWNSTVVNLDAANTTSNITNWGGSSVTVGTVNVDTTVTVSSAPAASAHTIVQPVFVLRFYIRAT